MTTFLFWEELCLNIHRSGFLPSFPLYVSGCCLQDNKNLFFAEDTVLFLEEEVRMLCFVSSSKAIRQIRQGALSARLQEGFSLRMEQLNNCYYLQWAKRRSILRTIRKGKVGHQAGKKAFKQHHTQRMWMSFQCKQLTIALLQITIPGVLAMCQALDIHYYL